LLQPRGRSERVLGYGSRARADDRLRGKDIAANEEIFITYGSVWFSKREMVARILK